MNATMLVSLITAAILSLSVHELAHGWAAERFGDPTAREAGRITLNPLKHIDLFQTIILPTLLYLTVGIIFGSAKPVPYNPNRFRLGTNVKRAIMCVAAAGPLSNFAMAFGSVLLRQMLLAHSNPGVTATYPYQFLEMMILCNLVLGVFNMLPIPPLDGADILAGFLPNPLAKVIYKLQRFAIVFLIMLVVWMYVSPLPRRMILGTIEWIGGHFTAIARILVAIVAS